MLFEEALSHLKARVPLYRKGWDPQDGYVVLMPGMSHVWKIVLQPAPNAGNYIFSVADLSADDWAVYIEPKLPIEASIAVEAESEKAA
ncbi:Protein of unknown function DUF2829 [uncultured Caudovirales phage]|uniref:Thoeris anti-defense 2-like domain-containing protein n=1 Tax=uncultured Caudovirales phage TaxID=2100421 RepID=A0A6J5L428_9CAUD|nr:Protein of unknown function DUF2829 [uncultured Caudovirales phage]